MKLILSQLLQLLWENSKEFMSFLKSMHIVYQKLQQMLSLQAKQE